MGSSLEDLMKELEDIRNSIEGLSCIEVLGRCNELITKSVKLAIKRAGTELKGPYTMNQLERAGLPAWYLNEVEKACSEAGILPFCAFLLEVKEAREGCTKLDAKRAVNAAEKVIGGYKEAPGGLMMKKFLDSSSSFSYFFHLFLRKTPFVMRKIKPR